MVTQNFCALVKKNRTFMEKFYIYYCYRPKKCIKKIKLPISLHMCTSIS